MMLLMILGGTVGRNDNKLYMFLPLWPVCFIPSLMFWKFASNIISHRFIRNMINRYSRYLVPYLVPKMGTEKGEDEYD